MQRMISSYVPTEPTAKVGKSSVTASKGLPRWVRHAARIVLQLAADAGAVVLAYRFAYEMRFHWPWWLRHFPITGIDPGWASQTRILLAVVPLWLAIFWYACELYSRPWQRGTDRFLTILKGAALGTLATLTASYIYDRMGFSRQMLIVAVPWVIAFVSIAETFILSLDAQIARFEATSPVLLIGGGRVAELLKGNLLERHPGLKVHEMEEFQSTEAILRLIAEVRIAEVILMRTPAQYNKILELAEACESIGVAFKMVPGLLELRLGEIQMDDSLGVPAYRVQHTSFSPANYVVKLIFDLGICLIVLALAGIPCALIALLIRLDSKGPILYRQKRLGYKGRTFEAYKFRTMSQDAESKIHEVRQTENAQTQKGFFKLKDDPRVTRVGRVLRQYSLDEFPQFINVFKGEMSAVGPRPLAVTTGEMENLIREFGSTAKKRLNILPGITGLWQVSGRSDTSPQQRFALDLFYIEHWSLGLDLQIILKTIPVMLGGKGAY